jgi:hypothetical protein
MVQGTRFRVQVARHIVQGKRFRVQIAWHMIQGTRFRAQVIIEIKVSPFKKTFYFCSGNGEMAEWSNAAVLKTSS